MSSIFYIKIFISSFLITFIIYNVSGKILPTDTIKYTDFDFLLNKNSKNYIVINKIIIEGNKKTKSNIILRELSFSENDTILSQKFQSVISEDKRKLINTDIFNEVEIKFFMIENNLINIKIEVVESYFWSPNIIFQLSDRNINDWWVNFNHDFKRINYGLGFEHTNITGRNDELFLLATFGFIREFEFEYFNPYITKKQKGGLEFNFNYYNGDHLEYITEKHIPEFVKSNNSLNKTISTYIEYSHRESFYNYHYFKIRYQITNINDTIRLLNDNYLNTNQNSNQFFSISYEFDRDFRDIKNYPLKGFRLNAKLEKNGIGIFGQVNKLKARIYYAKYFELKRKFYYSFNLFSYISSNNQPYYIYEDENEIRGYQTYLIHGHSNAVYRNTFKKEILNTNWSLEKYNIKKLKNFPFRIYMKLFFDSGYIWGYSDNNNNSDFTNKLIYSSGLGFDFVGIKNYSFSTEFSRNGENKYNFYVNFDIDF